MRSGSDVATRRILASLLDQPLWSSMFGSEDETASSSAKAERYVAA
jgi:hypothetical protein